MVILNSVQSDRVKVSMDDRNLNGLTSFSLSASNPLFKGSLMNLWRTPKTTYSSEPLFSASLDKFLTKYDIERVAKDFIMGNERSDLYLMTDSYEENFNGLVLEDSWFDEFAISVTASQMPTCSWEAKSKSLRVEDKIEVDAPSTGEGSFLRPEMMNLESSFDIFEYAESYNFSISTKKSLISSLWGDEKVWMNYPAITLSLTIPNSKKGDFLKITSFDSQDFNFEIFENANKTNKIFGVNIDNIQLDSVSDNFSESSSQTTSYSFSKILRVLDFTF